MSMKPEIRAALRAEMLPLVEAWRASGESRRAFAARHGISLPKFDYWARQAVAPPRRRRAATSFAPVTVVPAATAAGVIEVVLARGDRLVIRADAEPTVVRAVLTALCGKC